MLNKIFEILYWLSYLKHFSIKIYFLKSFSHPSTVDFKILSFCLLKCVLYHSDFYNVELRLRDREKRRRREIREKFKSGRRKDKVKRNRDKCREGDREIVRG